MKDLQDILDSVKPRPALPDQLERRFYRPRQAATVTGASPSQIFRWIESGDLRAFRRGRSLFIDVADLEEFIRAEVA